MLVGNQRIVTHTTHTHATKKKTFFSFHFSLHFLLCFFTISPISSFSSSSPLYRLLGFEKRVSQINIIMEDITNCLNSYFRLCQHFNCTQLNVCTMTGLSLIKYRRRYDNRPDQSFVVCFHLFTLAISSHIFRCCFVVLIRIHCTKKITIKKCTFQYA